MYVEVSFHKSLLLIILLKELLREATLLSCNIEYLTVIVLTSELICKHLCNDMATTTYLTTNVYD